MWWIFAQMADHCQAAHNKGFRYGVYTHYAFARDPVLYRMRGGFWLWNQPLDGYFPWQYFDSYSKVGAWGQKTNFYMVRPGANDVVNTIQWEGFREGADDGRYVSTLAMIVEKAHELGIKGALIDKAEKQLRYVDIQTFDETEAIGKAYNSFCEKVPTEKLQAARRDIADQIIAIQKKHPAIHSRKLRGDMKLADRAYARQLKRTPLITKPYPYGVANYEKLKEEFYVHFRKKDWAKARPIAERLRKLLLAKQKEFQKAPKPDFSGKYITPLEWWTLKQEVWDDLATAIRMQ
jgi:hypothetical protein